MKTASSLRASQVKDTAVDPNEDREDGRRLRSSRSREQIVRAMFDLIRGGDMTPSAARVAETAGVSLRTVFRHFEEMDTLSREMTAIVEAEIMPLIAKPLVSRGWRNQLEELVLRRVEIYERIMPLKVAGSIRRFQSTYLMEDYNRFIRHERNGLIAVLPAKILSNSVLLSALEMVTAFQAWRRLRQDQGLSVKEATAVTRYAVARLIGDD